MSLNSELEARIDAADTDGKLTDEQAAKITAAFVQEKTASKISELKQVMLGFYAGQHSGAPTEDDRFHFLLGIVATLLVTLELREGGK